MRLIKGAVAVRGFVGHLCYRKYCKHIIDTDCWDCQYKLILVVVK